MIRAALLAALVLSLNAGAALGRIDAPTASVPPPPEILDQIVNERLEGQRFTLSFGRNADGVPVCVETWTFGRRGALRVRSGEERVRLRYTLRATANPELFALDMTDRRTNGRLDCMGNEDLEVAPRRIWLSFPEGGGFMTCYPGDRQGCYGDAAPIAR
ncbi:MAG: hypothetical protein GC189_11180 [Alphaproteobacteria bacterium]|nr:hypothetical protein [Alphaproteobacteria bacterium]